MRLARPALALALIGSLAGAGAASAAVAKPKPVCNLVTDATGDAPTNVATDAQDDNFDIVSVDIASDKNNITAVLRLKALAATSTNSPEGINWGVNFEVEGTTFTMAAHSGPTGSIIYDASYQGATGGSIYGPGVTGAFDTTKKEVRITAPLSLFAEQADIRKGTKITGIVGSTAHEVAVPDPTPLIGGELFTFAYYGVDETEGGKDYVGETASCVKVGS